MARINILRDALSKWRVGLMTESEVIEVFKGVIDKMTIYTYNLDDYRNRLREYEKGRLSKYEQEVFSADKKVDSKQYEAAMAQIARAKYLRHDIEESLDAVEAYDKASELLNLFKHEIRLKSLIQRMPSILIIEKILKDAKQLMLKGRYLQAHTLVEFCSIETQRTKEERTEVQAQKIKEELFQSIEELKKICSDTLVYSKECKSSSFSVEGSIETTLFKFIEEGELKLVRKLIDDLNFVLKPRRSFRDRLHQYADLAKQNEKELRKGLKKDGWTGGANILLTLVNNRFLAKLTETETKLEEVQS